MKYKLILSGTKLEVIDNNIVIRKGLQFFIHKFLSILSIYDVREVARSLLLILFWIFLKNENYDCSFEYQCKNTRQERKVKRISQLLWKLELREDEILTTSSLPVDCRNNLLLHYSLDLVVSTIEAK